MPEATDKIAPTGADDNASGARRAMLEPGAAAEAWRAVAGAEGPASAVWLTLDGAEEALWVAPGLLAAFEALAQGKQDVAPETIEALWWHLSAHVRTMKTAIEEARALVRPLSRAERETAEAARRQAQAAAEPPANKRRVARALERAAVKLRTEAAGQARKPGANGKAHKPAGNGRAAA